MGRELLWLGSRTHLRVGLGNKNKKRKKEEERVGNAKEAARGAKYPIKPSSRPLKPPFFELFVIVDVSFPGPIRLLVTSVSPR